MAAEVALGHVGLILGLEVSRLARNNADWYRLLDLCAMTDTLIGDADGLYHPSLFNARLDSHLQVNAPCRAHPRKSPGVAGA
jgi:DNA invertase Pin-like site-specific DNA recombinase